MKNTLNSLVKLHRKFRDYSYVLNGWITTKYCENKIICYFAEKDNFTSVTIEDINIGFRDIEPFIEGPISKINEDYLSDLIERYEKILIVLKKQSEDIITQRTKELQK